MDIDVYMQCIDCEKDEQLTIKSEQWESEKHRVYGFIDNHRGHTVYTDIIPQGETG